MSARYPPQQIGDPCLDRRRLVLIHRPILCHPSDRYHPSDNSVTLPACSSNLFLRALRPAASHVFSAQPSRLLSAPSSPQRSLQPRSSSATLPNGAPITAPS